MVNISRWLSFNSLWAVSVATYCPSRIPNLSQREAFTIKMGHPVFKLTRPPADIFIIKECSSNSTNRNCWAQLPKLGSHVTCIFDCCRNMPITKCKPFVVTSQQAVTNNTELGNHEFFWQHTSRTSCCIASVGHCPFQNSYHRMALQSNRDKRGTNLWERFINKWTNEVLSGCHHLSLSRS